MQLPANVIYLTGSIKCQSDSGLMHVKCYQKSPIKLVLIGETDIDLSKKEFKSYINNLPLDHELDKYIYISVSKVSSDKVIAAVYREGNTFYIGYNNKRSAKLKLYDMVSLLVGMGVDGDSSTLDDMLSSCSSWLQVSLDRIKSNKRSAYWPEHNLNATNIGESMNNLVVNKDVVSRLLESINPSISEASKYTIEHMMDQEMIDYMNQNIDDPAKKDRFLKARKRFEAMADREPDKLMAMYYEMRMYLSAGRAMNVARQFYQSEMRSKTYADVTIISTDEEEYSQIDSTSFGTGFASKGMFANLGSRGKSPEKIFEIDDFLTKLFDSKYLDSQDRILLVAYLLLGTGPKLRAKPGAGSRQGLDIQGTMNNPPKELGIVEDQITKLLKFGIDPDNISLEKIIRGANKGDAETGSVGVPPLMSTSKQQSAQANIKKAVYDLVGSQDMKEISKFLLTSPLNPLGAYEEAYVKTGKSVPQGVEKRPDRDSKLDNSIIIDAIGDYLQGNSVIQKSLIKAIVFAVNTNIKRKTRLSKSKIFSGSVKQIATAYLKLAKSGKDENTMKVQDMFMAPIFDEKLAENK